MIIRQAFHPARSAPAAGCIAATLLLATNVAYAQTDTTAPAAIDAYRLVVTFDTPYIITLAAPPGSVESLARVRILNHRTAALSHIYAAADGSFRTQLAAQRGDGLTLTVLDAAGNSSTPIEVYAGSFRIKNPLQDGQHLARGPGAYPYPYDRWP